MRNSEKVKQLENIGTAGDYQPSDASRQHNPVHAIKLVVIVMEEQYGPESCCYTCRGRARKMACILILRLVPVVGVVDGDSGHV